MQYVLLAISSFFLIIHFFYLLKWWTGLSRLARKQKQYKEVQPGISVVVCAHDEEENLRALIPLLYQQDYPDFEIIIVDDRSNDGTYDLLLEEKSKGGRLKMVRVESTPAHVNGKKYGLTLGIKAAKYDIVLLTDADCRPASPRWISEMAKGFQSEEVQIVLGYSPYERKPSFLNKFIQWETSLTAINYLGSAGWGGAFMGVGRNLAYRKSLFIENKGFNAHLKLTGGDDDLFVNGLAHANNVNAVLNPDSIVYSFPKTTFGDYRRQKLRHLSIGKRYKTGDKINLGLWALSQIGFWATFLILALRSVEPYALLAGFLGREVFTFCILSYFHRLTGQRFNYWLLPVIDFLYGVYLLLIGSRATFAKRVTWT